MRDARNRSRSRHAARLAPVPVTRGGGWRVDPSLDQPRAALREPLHARRGADDVRASGVDRGRRRRGRRRLRGAAAPIDPPMRGRGRPLPRPRGALAAVEDMAAGLALERDLLRASESVVLTSARTAPPGGALRACVVAADGRTVAEAPLPSPGRYELARADQIGDGPCTVVCRWQPDGAGAEPVPVAELELRAVETVPAPPGYGRLAERRRMILEHFAAERGFTWAY